jgi:hypothetical protein
VDADTFVLTLPMAQQQEGLALFVFIGGLSAATGMVIVETIALSTMVCNDLVMPAAALRWMGWLTRPTSPACCWASGAGRSPSSSAWATSTSASPARPTRWSAIGLISFAAVAQFAPVVIGGIFWKGGTRDGAVAGSPPVSRCGSTPAAAVLRQVGLAAGGLHRPSGLFGIPLLRRSSCSA